MDRRRGHRVVHAVLRIEAQLRAHCLVNPPDVLGVEAVVAAVEVHAEETSPASLYDQADALVRAGRGRRWSAVPGEDNHVR